VLHQLMRQRARRRRHRGCVGSPRCRRWLGVAAPLCLHIQPPHPGTASLSLAHRGSPGEELVTHHPGRPQARSTHACDRDTHMQGPVCCHQPGSLGPGDTQRSRPSRPRL
jgi:hypothetical protein